MNNRQSQCLRFSTHRKRVDSVLSDYSTNTIWGRHALLLRFKAISTTTASTTEMEAAISEVFFQVLRGKSLRADLFQPRAFSFDFVIYTSFLCYSLPR